MDRSFLGGRVFGVKSFVEGEPPGKIDRSLFPRERNKFSVGDLESS